jgi:hypothetical protein
MLSSFAITLVNTYGIKRVVHSAFNSPCRMPGLPHQKYTSGLSRAVKQPQFSLIAHVLLVEEAGIEPASKMPTYFTSYNYMTSTMFAYSISCAVYY